MSNSMQDALSLSVDSFDYVFELGQRFPDMTDDEVCRSYEDYTGVPYLNTKSFVGALVLQCYVQGIAAARELRD